ncbi:hypothetical protein BH23PAT2_BH23PAT2_01270 [soil metagenome]
MQLFKRKKQDEVLPDEVRDYYKAEQRDRMGMAWLLAAGVFLATIAIVIALFFGGRWVYRTVFDSGNNDGTTAVDEADEASQRPVGDELFGSDNDEEDEAGGNDSDTSDTNEENGADFGDNDATNEGADSGESDANPRQTPTTGPTVLPSTGPSGNE